MNPREKLSAVLLSLGLVLALLPLSSGRSLTVRSGDVLSQSVSSESELTVDQVARMVESRDSTLQLIDLRSEDKFRTGSIPGAINLPYSRFLDSDPDRFLNNSKMKYVFLAEGDLQSGYALVISRGLRYENTYVMKGGMDEWFDTVINSGFSGERLSPRENALFESRLKARKMFTEFNSLPDSLKIKYFSSRQIASRKLDGGCE